MNGTTPKSFLFIWHSTFNSIVHKFSMHLLSRISIIEYHSFEICKKKDNFICRWFFFSFHRHCSSEFFMFHTISVAHSYMHTTQDVFIAAHCSFLYMVVIVCTIQYASHTWPRTYFFLCLLQSSIVQSNHFFLHHNLPIS